MFNQLKKVSSNFIMKGFGRQEPDEQEESLPPNMPEPFDLDTIPLSKGTDEERLELQEKEKAETDKN